jgi:hypothetical protein
MRSSPSVSMRLIRAASLPPLVLALGVSAGLGASAATHDQVDVTSDGYGEVLVAAPGAHEWLHAITTEPAAALTRLGNPMAGQEHLKWPGAALAGCDITADGFDDVVAGDPQAIVPVDGVDLYNAGAVVVSYGSDHGLTTGPIIGQQTTGVPGTAEADDYFGFSVACGDLNADGFADIVVGSPYEALDTRVAAGMVTVIPGSASGPDTAHASSITQDTAGVYGSAEPGDAFGWALAVGDLTGDALPEVVIAAPHENSTIGMVHSIPGAATATGWTPSGSTAVYAGDLPGARRFGEGLVVGHFTGRSVNDLAAYSTELDYSGAVYLFRGGPANLAAPGAAMINQTSEDVPGTSEKGDHWGSTLAAGNVNGDAYDDLLVGVPNEKISGVAGAGAACLLKGSDVGLTGAGSRCYSQGSPGVPGSLEPDEFGASVLLTDLDHDGRDDAVIGSPLESHADLWAGGMVHYFRTDGVGLIPNGSATAHSLGGTNHAGAWFGLALVG